MNKYFLLTILFFSSSILFSQTNTGSPYSINELGEINFSGNVSNLSMGGIDVKVDSIEVNLNNPASYAKLKTSNYLVGTFFKLSSFSNTIANENISSSNINYIAVGIPVKKFGFGFGVLPYSSTGFNLQSDESYNTNNSVNTRLFAANGGINRVFFSVGFPLTNFQRYCLKLPNSFFILRTQFALLITEFTFCLFRMIPGLSKSSSIVAGLNWEIFWGSNPSKACLYPSLLFNIVSHDNPA